MSGIFSGGGGGGGVPQPVALPTVTAGPITPATPPGPSSLSVQNAALAAAQQAQSGRGLASTLLTSGLGVLGPQSTRRPYVLGTA
jgi:hypothetical protein